MPDVLANAPLGDGRKVVTTAGTRVQLAAAGTRCKSVLVTALETNIGTVVCGGSTVVAALGTTGATGTRRGTPLNASESARFDVHDVAQVWMDSTLDAEGVSFSYEKI